MESPAGLRRIPMQKTGSSPARLHRKLAMLDVLYLILGVGGFAVCLGYVHLCDRL